jgi:hypothetical protein
MVDNAQFAANATARENMKTAAQAATKYGTNGSAASATQLWATNFNSNISAILDAATAAAPTWQNNVSLPQSAVNYKNGLQKAKSKIPQIQTKVTNVGAPALAAGVRAASTGAYLSFANAFIPAVTAEVANLNASNPRGTRQQNRARQAAYDAWIDSQAGNFKQ